MMGQRAVLGVMTISYISAMTISYISAMTISYISAMTISYITHILPVALFRGSTGKC